MLSLYDVSCSTGPADRDGNGGLSLLEGITATIPEGHFVAAVGPSGCGKTTLLKLIAGLLPASGGRMVWRGEDLEDRGELSSRELGYVPQFSIAHEFLTVAECIANAVRLRIRADADARRELADRVMHATGMTALRDRRVAVLSGGQKRRLGLAMELVTSPALLLCDEVTTGLDSHGEAEIVRLLHALSRDGRRSVVHVTHSLTHLDLCDSVLVLYHGRIVYHGPPKRILHYFSIDRVEDVYTRLADRTAAEWQASWDKRREIYYESMGIVPTPAPAPPEPPAPPDNSRAAADGDPAAAAPLPGVFRQFAVLFFRRWILFFRDRMQCGLHLALILGFPLLVAIFVWNGIGPMPARHGADMQSWDIMRAEAGIAAEQTRLGVLISGLVMFQVVLLTLQGAGNGSREIAGERLLYEKERLAGLRPSAYLLSKLSFLAVLVAVQSVWMGVFVEYFADFPGRLADRMPLLLLSNAAMTSVCLAISSLLRSAEQASLFGIYLVGFQLPLSGAVLALPGALETVVRPFVAACWGWSGQLATMRESEYFVAIARAVPTDIVRDSGTAIAVLVVHVLAGIAVAWAGCLHRRWD